jgi:hypothetical protein
MISQLIARFAPWIAGALGVSVLALGTMTWLYLEKRDDVSTAISNCNADKAASIAEAERLTRKALQTAFAEEIAKRDRRIEALERARQIAEEGYELAAAQAQANEAVIRRLELEGETDDIPDSFEALNVFVPNCALDWVRNPEGVQREAGADRDSRENYVCGGPRRFDPTTPFARIFSSITYADSFVLWGRERAELKKCNADKAAIETLMEQTIEGGG